MTSKVAGQQRDDLLALIKGNLSQIAMQELRYKQKEFDNDQTSVVPEDPTVDIIS